jgi:hypothetical protein
MVFAPCTPLALLAHARPPDPPPMTRKSHSFVMGAMMLAEDENCRERDESLAEAVFEAVPGTARVRRVNAFMRIEVREGRGRVVFML